MQGIQLILNLKFKIFLVAILKLKKMRLTNFNNIFHTSKILFQNTINIKLLIQSLFILSLQNPVCLLHLRHISMRTSHISSAQQPHGVRGYCIGQQRSRGSSSSSTNYFQIFCAFFFKRYTYLQYILLSFKNLMKNQIVIVDTSSLFLSLASIILHNNERSKNIYINNHKIQDMMNKLRIKK